MIFRHKHTYVVYKQYARIKARKGILLLLSLLFDYIYYVISQCALAPFLLMPVAPPLSATLTTGAPTIITVRPL